MHYTADTLSVYMHLCWIEVISTCDTSKSKLAGRTGHLMSYVC